MYIKTPVPKYAHVQFMNPHPLHGFIGSELENYNNKTKNNENLSAFIWNLERHGINFGVLLKKWCLIKRRINNQL